MAVMAVTGVAVVAVVAVVKRYAEKIKSRVFSLKPDLVVYAPPYPWGEDFRKRGYPHSDYLSISCKWMSRARTEM